jgi:hypothetical protein
LQWIVSVHNDAQCRMSRCRLTFTGIKYGARFIHSCDVCGRQYKSPEADPSRLKVECGVESHSETGPGHELKLIFDALGFSPKARCGCDGLRMEMNALGVDGCRRDFDRIAGLLREKYNTTTTAERIAAAVAAVRGGIALFVNPLDPVPGLLSLAIDRAASRGCDPPASAPH